MLVLGRGGGLGVFHVRAGVDAGAAGGGAGGVVADACDLVLFMLKLLLVVVVLMLMWPLKLEVWCEVWRSGPW